MSSSESSNPHYVGSIGSGNATAVSLESRPALDLAMSSSSSSSTIGNHQNLPISRSPSPSPSTRGTSLPNKLPLTNLHATTATSSPTTTTITSSSSSPSSSLLPNTTIPIARHFPTPSGGSSSNFSQRRDVNSNQPCDNPNDREDSTSTTYQLTHVPSQPTSLSPSQPNQNGSFKSRRRRPSLDRLDTSSQLLVSLSPTSTSTHLPVEREPEESDTYGHSTARFSPSTPTATSLSNLGNSPSSAYRRRQSTSLHQGGTAQVSNILPAAPRRKKSSRDSVMHICDMTTSQGSSSSSTFGWTSSLAPPPHLKVSKSDDEREEVGESYGSHGEFTNNKFWSWNAAQRPSNTHSHPSFYSYASTLSPLPVDPDHLLPLSAPSTPAGSAAPTPLHSPRGSIVDLAGDCLGLSVNGPGEKGASLPIQTTMTSPRTSTSTNSSRFAWSQGGRSWSESSSRSGGEDEDCSPVLTQRQWWWRHTDKSDNQTPNQSVAFPTVPRIIRQPPQSYASSSTTSKVASWQWFRDNVGSVLRMKHGTKGKEEVHRSLRAIKQTKERQKLDRSRRLRMKNELGPKWLGRMQAFIPTKASNVAIFVLCFGIFATLMTLMIKHILDPDKEALPWRSYCLADYPRLYSLYDPSSSPYDPHSHSTELLFTSSPSFKPLPLNSFLPFSSGAHLAPLTPSHPLWPYGTDIEPPYVNDLNGRDVDEVNPVGVFVGVMTTDSSVERRMMIRQSYASHWRSRKVGTEGVRVRFIMGRPRGRFKEAVEMEMEAFNDILILDMAENMNSGKTHAFFSWAAENATVPDWSYDRGKSKNQGNSDINDQGRDDDDILLTPVWRGGERRPDYVVKADDDSFIMLGELERRLRVTPRTKTYWGYLVKNQFMAGECYALSLDLVEYIAASPALRTLTRGKEDKLVAKWIKMHPEREKIVWVAERCWIYDHPKAGTVYSHGFLFPSEVEKLRTENQIGINGSTLGYRGGNLESARAYSTVSKFGTPYRPTFSKKMNVRDRVEALVEGSNSSLSQSGKACSFYSSSSSSPIPSFSSDNHQQRVERFLGDQKERGGTVVVHFIKKPEWFVETMIALLGNADEQERYEINTSGVEFGMSKGVGLGSFEMGLKRLEPGSGRVSAEIVKS